MVASFGIEDGEKCLQSWDIGDRTAILCEYCGSRTTMSPGSIKTTDFMVLKNGGTACVRRFSSRS